MDPICPPIVLVHHIGWYVAPIINYFVVEPNTMLLGESRNAYHYAWPLCKGFRMQGVSLFSLF